MYQDHLDYRHKNPPTLVLYFAEFNDTAIKPHATYIDQVQGGYLLGNNLTIDIKVLYNNICMYMHAALSV